MRTKRIVRFLTAEDVVDMELNLARGKILAFALNYRAYIKEAWREGVRYDTAHGGPHVHRFWLGPEARPWPGPDPSDLEACVDWADADLDRRWPEYRARLEAQW